MTTGSVVTTGSVATEGSVVIVVVTVEVLVVTAVDCMLLFSSLGQLDTFFSPNKAIDNYNECTTMIHRLT